MCSIRHENGMNGELQFSLSRNFTFIQIKPQSAGRARGVISCYDTYCTYFAVMCRMFFAITHMKVSVKIPRLEEYEIH